MKIIIMKKIKLTPNEWCLLTGIIVFDPDGWDRRGRDKFDEDWAKYLTFDEFMNKCSISTTNGVNASEDMCKINIMRNITYYL